MKKIQALLLLAGMTFLSTSPLLAQSVKLTSGTLGFLKGQTTLNVEYSYEGMTVGKITEDEYIKKNVSEHNAKEAGKGDKWLEAWKANRASRFQPKFEELLNKQFQKSGLSAGKNPDAKYTLVLKTLNLEPGFNVAVMRMPAMISTQAELYETKDRTKQLALITILKAPGRDAMGYDFDVGYRLQEGYAKTGKELGALIVKKGLK